MTTAEFDRWWSDLVMRFPNVESWLLRSSNDENSQRRLLRSWCCVFDDVNLVDAVEVNGLMQSGDLDFVADFHEQDIPKHVRRLARKLSWERASDTNQEPSPELQPTSFPAGKILKRILELTDRGMPSKEAREIVLAELPVGKPKYEPRYSCRLCFDSGSVDVAPPWAVRAMLDDCFEKCHHRNASARCKCRPPLPSDSRWKQATYESSECFKVDDLQWPQDQVDRFREWCEAKREEFWNSKREPAFDHFNQREFSR